MYDVVALGELLIDFISDGAGSDGNPAYEANPGGAPCNVLAMLEKLGYRAAFIGKVGNDMFGRQLEGALQRAGISTVGLIKEEKANTTLAFVQTKPDGDRDFSFYREKGADTLLTKDDISPSLTDNCRIFHFGTLSMTDEPASSATKYALDRAKKAGALISFDPNYRPPLWKSEDRAKEAALYGINNCNILKIADNELAWLTGTEDTDRGIEELKKHSPAEMIFVTLGKKGSIAYYRGMKVYSPTFLGLKAVDTTGAGDTFCACALGYILKHGLNDLTEKQLSKLLRFANAAASIVCTRKGALLSMPAREEIEKVLNETKE